MGAELKEAFDFREGLVFLDVGAHVGRYSIRAGKKLGKSRKVVAIEPSRTNYGILCKNIALNKLDNCIALNVAAYSKDCLLSLFRGDDSAKNSLSDDSGRGSYMVKARALDNILCELGLNYVDLIKIDVEGAEFDALRGLEQTLRYDNPKLMIEILVTDKEKVKDYLLSLGYSGRLLHSSVDYKEGILYYLFTKTKFAL